MQVCPLNTDEFLNGRQRLLLSGMGAIALLCDGGHCGSLFTHWKHAVYALPLAHAERVGRVYAPGMEDCYCYPVPQFSEGFVSEGSDSEGPVLKVTLLNQGFPARVLLVPVARTVLRIVGFA